MWHETSLSLEEKVASLFQQDPLLPAQYLETFKRIGKDSRERWRC